MKELRDEEFVGLSRGVRRLGFGDNGRAEFVWISPPYELFFSERVDE